MQGIILSPSLFLATQVIGSDKSLTGYAGGAKSQDVVIRARKSNVLKLQNEEYFTDKPKRFAGVR
ncbi:hypothetical protein [Helicobacter typhlonius]|uniref:hypothetical protein n=1 Tax=Helicobacter typhlonius TaxID=76936 RepID=UPI002FE1C794